MNKLLLINKPQNMTSFDVVAIVRKTLNIKKIGHTGTLDPNAEGLIVILIDKATKALPFLHLNRKEYFASLRLGIKTNTGDIWGDVIEEAEIPSLSNDTIINVLNSFIGKSMQTPPKVSAISVKGKRLYEYARNNEEVIIPEREIEIFEIECLRIDSEIHFRVQCSSGTYIRSLCEDIATKLGTVGTMSKLTRTKIEMFPIENAYTIEQIRNHEFEFESVDQALVYPKYEVENIDDVKNGKKIRIDSDEEMILLTHKNEVLAIYEKDEEQHTYRCLRGLW
jgi:tRNA pseudouridine55 synthase